MNYIDLGLSVKWATCNVGASLRTMVTTLPGAKLRANKAVKPLSIGVPTSGAMARTTPKPNTVLTPIMAQLIIRLYSKPLTMPLLLIGGDLWRMPTLKEMEELINKCMWTWTTLNGVNGYKVVGLNGNSIFLPAAGY